MELHKTGFHGNERNEFLFEEMLCITNWEWSAAELPVRVDVIVRHDELMIQIRYEATQTGG